MAGFQVTPYGRFWVTPKDGAAELMRQMPNQRMARAIDLPLTTAAQHGGETDSVHMWRQLPVIPGEFAEGGQEVEGDSRLIALGVCGNAGSGGDESTAGRPR